MWSTITQNRTVPSFYRIQCIDSNKYSNFLVFNNKEDEILKIDCGLNAKSVDKKKDTPKMYCMI